MFGMLYKFGKAYQVDLIRSQQSRTNQGARLEKFSYTRISVQELLGDALINLGERIKGEQGCIDVAGVAYE